MNNINSVSVFSGEAQERGGMSLYGFVDNNPISKSDLLGLMVVIPPDIDIFIPPPVILPGDKVGTNFTGFAICQRPLTEDNFLDKCLNACGTGHKFIASFDEGKATEGWGFYPSGKVENEKTLACPRGVECKKSGKTLKYGVGASKPGKNATDEAIRDCIKKRPPLGPYTPPRNDCRHWASQAASDCGLSCN